MKYEEILRKKKLLNWWITAQNYIGAGRGQIDFIINSGKIGVYVTAGLYFLGLDVRERKELIPLFSLIYLVGTFVIGWGWDKIKGFDIGNEWTNKRNPMLKRIEKK
ncbi:hypothetical protein CMI41_03640 [Candidatus Pacearchaeota archaeon]|nr:hypothetical protein [Candidatus Pacearchaeota archaeon]|tara:strand:+ start:1074 stop:1391 length:318 start_codon:yes stop_codon:yes gene_type:complete